MDNSKTWKRKLDEATEKGLKYREKYYNSNKKLKRAKEAIINLQQKLSEAYKKFNIDQEKQNHISNAADLIPLKLLKKSLDNQRDYDESIRKFALTLHFYSAKAYKFVHEQFNKALPHENTLYKWCCKLNGKPGFTEESFNYIRETIVKNKEQGKELVFSLSMDEMKLHRHLYFNGNEIVGGVDIGLGAEDNEQEEATDALVFMLTCVNSRFKLPIGYFLIKSLTGEERANLVNICFDKLNSIEARVMSLTSDGPACNISMAGILGAKFQPECPQPKLARALSGENIVYILDPVHMLKLVRNTFCDHKILKKDDKVISWQYIVELYNLQEQRGLYLCNKLSKNLVYYQNHPMKVKYAAQLLSNSVADALDYARDVLKFKQFEGSEETSTFIRTFNDLLDIQNSSSKFASGCKSPLNPETRDRIFTRMDELSAYVLGITDSQGKPIVTCGRKTGFLGK